MNSNLDSYAVIINRSVEKVGSIDDVARYLVSIDDWLREEKQRYRVVGTNDAGQTRVMTTADQRRLSTALASAKEESQGGPR